MHNRLIDPIILTFVGMLIFTFTNEKGIIITPNLLKLNILHHESSVFGLIT